MNEQRRTEDTARKSNENGTKILERSIKKRRKIDEISILGGLGARGRLRDAAGRVRNGLGMPTWAVLATKLAVLGASWAPSWPSRAPSLPSWAPSGPSRTSFCAQVRAKAFFDRFSDELSMKNRSSVLIVFVTLVDVFFDRFSIHCRSIFRSTSTSHFESSIGAEPRFLSPLSMFFDVFSKTRVRDRRQKRSTLQTKIDC